MAGLAYIKFFGADWRRDQGLRLCSPAARGVWIDAISLMMEAERYGHLVINGQPMTPAQFATLTATSVKAVRDALAELERNGVLSKTDDGTIYSRRLVKDKAKLEEAKAYGKSGGNPALKGDGKPDSNPPPPTGPLTPPDNPPFAHTRESHQPSAISQEEAAAAAARADAAAIAETVLTLLGNHPSLLNTGRVTAWLRDGCDPELDVYPTIRSVLTRERKRQQDPQWVPRGLDYFDGAIADALAKRLKPMPNGHADEPRTSDRNPRRRAVEAALAGAAAAVNRGSGQA